MPSIIHRALWPIAGLLAVCLSGCGGQEASLTGIVTLQGKPAPGLIMNFQNVGSGPMAYALTHEDGSYESHTGSTTGLPAGKYKLAFESADPNFPKQYQTIVTSGLEYDVKKGKNKIDIPLQ
jgi:hypothetical protein